MLRYNGGTQNEFGGTAVVNTAFYEILIDGLHTSARVSRIVRGISWTAAVLDNGGCGVAMRTAGETVSRCFATLEGQTVRDAARAIGSWNLEEASEGMAVINAFYNTVERLEYFGCRYTESAQEGIDLQGRTVGFVGHMLRSDGSTEKLLRVAKEWYVLEREPKSGDYPDSACEYILPKCDLVFITGSAAVNKTLPRLLELTRHAQIVLTGPTVPLCPELLGLGIFRLNGQVITRTEPMLRQIVEAQTSVNAFSRHFTLDA